MLTSIIGYLLIFIQVSFSYVLDYTKANKNAKVYNQVPVNEVIFAKYQALEPSNFYQAPHRGKGFLEPIYNEFINALRESHITVYVDYFTVIKAIFYSSTDGYEICIGSTRSFKDYKIIFNLNKNKGAIGMNKKWQVVGLPYLFLPSSGIVGIGSKKRNLFSKHFWPGTIVYNTKSLLDDPDLYTAQVSGMYSSIKEFIYDKRSFLSPSTPIILSKYKRRVYDFVASNAYQIPLMLKGKRMDYVDLGMFGDFYIKKLKIGVEDIMLAPISNIHPQSQTKDDIKVVFNICMGQDLQKLKKQIKIVDNVVKKLRTNVDFWTSVLKQYSIDLGLPYEAPEEFYYTKTMVQYKKEIDRGDFDLL